MRVSVHTFLTIGLISIVLNLPCPAHGQLPTPTSADIDSSGLVNMLDLVVFSEHWNEVTGPGSGLVGDINENCLSER